MVLVNVQLDVCIHVTSYMNEIVHFMVHVLCLACRFSIVEDYDTFYVQLKGPTLVSMHVHD